MSNVEANMITTRTVEANPLMPRSIAGAVASTGKGKPNKTDKLKRLQQPRKEKKEAIIRSKKLRGEEHINHVGNFVGAKTIGPVCNCKRLKCFRNVSGSSRKEIFQKFYALESKNQQDSYLAALMCIMEVKQRRPRKQRKCCAFN